MVNLQTQFSKFHETIKIDFDESQYLRDKRDLIVNNLRDGLKKLFAVQSLQPPIFHSFNQGSYDLAIYSSDQDNFGREINYIAKGYSNSSEDYKFWEVSEPFKLKELLKSKFPDQLDRDQFRRIIRYLKRWKDYNFSSTIAGKPTGIALTACCYNLFEPKKNYEYQSYPYQYKYNDLEALKNVVNGIISMFNWQNQIIVQLPVQPYNDLFEKMTDDQMGLMKNKLITLRDTLITVSNEYYALNACKALQKVFGQDFPLY